MLYLTCTTITSIDLAHYGVSRAKDWVSVKCGTSCIFIYLLENNEQSDHKISDKFDFEQDQTVNVRGTGPLKLSRIYNEKITYLKISKINKKKLTQFLFHL